MRSAALLLAASATISSAAAAGPPATGCGGPGDADDWLTHGCATPTTLRQSTAEDGSSAYILSNGPSVPALNTKGYFSRVLISLLDSLMFGRVPKNAAPFSGTRPNISESHSEISTRVPFYFVAGIVSRTLVANKTTGLLGTASIATVAPPRTEMLRQARPARTSASTSP